MDVEIQDLTPKGAAHQQIRNISGQDPACVIGQTPISLLKVALLVALILAGFAAGMIGLILSSM